MINLSWDTTLVATVSGAIAAGFAIFYSAIAAKRVAEATMQMHQHTIAFQHAVKFAEFEQNRIKDLRDTMALFQSYGVTPDLDHHRERELYASGTKIELLVGSNHPQYEAIQDSLYAFLGAQTTAEKFAANPRYVMVCQDILNSAEIAWKAQLNEAKSRTLTG